MRGLFVTFEGIDRSGKTTQAGLLVDALGDAALGVREPGGTADAAGRAGESDRFEDEGEELQEAVGAAYEHLMEADPERWRRIDATRSPDEVHADVLAAVKDARE